MNIVKHQQQFSYQFKWLVTGRGEGWIYKQRFPRKWKAELAVKIFKEGGKLTDYWRAAKEEKKVRNSTRPRIDDHIAKARNKYPNGPEIKSDEVVVVCRNIGSGSIEVSVGKLRDFHVRSFSGGVGSVFATPMLCARMMCTEIPKGAYFGHSCAHGDGPHEIVVCIPQSSNNRNLYQRLLAQVRGS